ncbi:MAG: replication protein [Desulfotomaculaceae bacterium]|nr:replication protein [Desulfotomaculaceae bacterium]
MANPQKENGYMAIAHEILDAMARTKLSPIQYRLLFVIWRYTYGFHQKSARLSLAFLAGATGCDKRQIQRDLKGLEQRRIIFQDTGEPRARSISFNKDYDQWLAGPPPPQPVATIGETGIGEITIGQIDNTAIGEIATGESAIGQIDNTTIGETVNRAIGAATVPPLVKPPTNKDISLKIYKNKKDKEKDNDKDLFNFPDNYWQLIDQVDAMPPKQQINLIVFEHKKKYPLQYKENWFKKYPLKKAANSGYFTHGLLVPHLSSTEIVPVGATEEVPPGTETVPVPVPVEGPSSTDTVPVEEISGTKTVPVPVPVPVLVRVPQPYSGAASEAPKNIKNIKNRELENKDPAAAAIAHEFEKEFSRPLSEILKEILFDLLDEGEPEPKPWGITGACSKPGPRCTTRWSGSWSAAGKVCGTCRLWRTAMPKKANVSLIYLQKVPF